MKSTSMLLLLLLIVGCESKGGKTGGKTSRLNELSFSNGSAEQISKVVVEWNDQEFTMTNQDRALEAGSRSIRKLPIREPIETTFKITVHFAADDQAVVHEETISLRPEERKLIEVHLTRERKIVVGQKQRDPHILPP